MALDVRLLRKEVASRKAERKVEGGDANKRRRTGAMAIVRDHLADIEVLRAEGVRWGDIAAAMAAQGVTQGDGAPLTERRLTALIASVRKQAADRSSAHESRSARADAVERTATPAEAAPVQSRLTLSLDLVSAGRDGFSAPDRDAEEALRRDNYGRVQALLKGGPGEEGTR